MLTVEDCQSLTREIDWEAARLAGLRGRQAATDVGGTPPSLRKTATPKRSTHQGEAAAKLIAALSQHHGYNSHGDLRYDAIGSNDLAKKADVGKATASAFFKAEFEGYRQYRTMCEKNRQALARRLSSLNGEHMSHYSYGRTPPGEGMDEDRGGA
jgi:hypothetical protein